MDIFQEIAVRGRQVQCHRRWTGVVGRLLCKRLASRRRYELMQILEAEGLQRYQAVIASLYDLRTCRRLSLSDLAEAGTLRDLVRPVHLQRMVVASKLAAAGVAPPAAAGRTAGWGRAGGASVVASRPPLYATTPPPPRRAAAASPLRPQLLRATPTPQQRLAVGGFVFVVRREAHEAGRGEQISAFLARIIDLGPRDQSWLKLALWNETAPGSREYTDGSATLIEHASKLVPVNLSDLVYDPNLRTVRCANIPLIPGVAPAAVARCYAEEASASECDFEVFATLRFVGDALPDVRQLLPAARQGAAALGCVELGPISARLVNTLSALLRTAVQIRCAYSSGAAVAIDIVCVFSAQPRGGDSGTVGVALQTLHRTLKSPEFARTLYDSAQVHIVQSSEPVVYALRRVVGASDDPRAATPAAAAAPPAAAPIQGASNPVPPTTATARGGGDEDAAKGECAWEPELGSFVFCENSRWIELIDNPDRPRYWVARVLRTLPQRGVAQLQWFRETGIASFSYQQTSRTFVERCATLRHVRGMRLDVVLNLWMCPANAFDYLKEEEIDDDAPGPGGGGERERGAAGVSASRSSVALGGDITTNVDSALVVPRAAPRGAAAGHIAASAREASTVQAAEIAALRSQLRSVHSKEQQMFAEAQAAAQRRVHMEQEMLELKKELRIAIGEALDESKMVGLHGAAPLIMPWGSPPALPPSSERPLPPPTEPPPPL